MEEEEEEEEEDEEDEEEEETAGDEEKLPEAPVPNEEPVFVRSSSPTKESLTGTQVIKTSKEFGAVHEEEQHKPKPAQIPLKAAETPKAPTLTTFPSLSAKYADLSSDDEDIPKINDDDPDSD